MCVQSPKRCNAPAFTEKGLAEEGQSHESNRTRTHLASAFVPMKRCQGRFGEPSLPRVLIDWLD